jgi:hypothetical protein
METYKNNYSKEEDQLLWELHEIRHKLHNRNKNKTINDINKEALKKFAEWQEKKDSNHDN